MFFIYALYINDLSLIEEKSKKYMILFYQEFVQIITSIKLNFKNLIIAKSKFLFNTIPFFGSSLNPIYCLAE